MRRSPRSIHIGLRGTMMLLGSSLFVTILNLLTAEHSTTRSLYLLLRRTYIQKCLTKIGRVLGGRKNKVVTLFSGESSGVKYSAIPDGWNLCPKLPRRIMSVNLSVDT